jgi:hypothetical protein
MAMCKWKPSRFEQHEPKWWALVTVLAEKWQLPEACHGDIFELVCHALDEDAARWAGASGGRRGGAVRAARMTGEQRSDAARKAALARWRRKP